MLRTVSLPILVAVGALLICPSIFAQGGDAPAASTDPVVVGIVGASVSGGFADPRPLADGDRNRTVPLRRALQPMWSEDAVVVRDRSDITTFLDPDGRQTPRIERLLGEEPALVIGVDVMFWFGYGFVGGGDQLEGRLALQKRGFELLEQFQCPVVVGDYPDMRGADRRMLNPLQIPDTETLAALNAELRRWAAERSNVYVYPLAAWVVQLKEGGVDVEYGHSKIRLTPDRLLQGDRLHATRLGMAVLGEGLAGFLRDALPEDDPLRPAELGFEDFVVAAGAALDMDEAIEAQEQAEEPAGEEAPEPQEAR